MTQKVPVIPAVSDDVPLNTRRVLLAMKTSIEFLLTQTGVTTGRAATVSVVGGTTGSTVHNATLGLQGGATGEYYHFTLSQHNDLTDGGDATVHYHASDRALANATGTLAWAQVDKTGALLTDLSGTFGHNNLELTSVQGGAAGEQYHMTASQWASHTQGTDNTLHYHATDRDSANFTGTSWASLVSSGSTTLHTHDHNTTTSLQGGTTDEYYHLTAAQHTDLTDAGATTLHKHDHGGQDGLADDDHTQYVLANGTRNITGPQEFEDNIVLPNASGKGIQVNTTTPAFGWRDITADPNVRGVGAADPTFGIYTGTVMRQYSFSATIEQEVFFTFHMPHDYVPGTAIHFHAHWSNAAATPDTGDVMWGFDYSFAKGFNQEAFPAFTSITVTQACPATRYQHMVAETTGVTFSPALEVDGLILVRGYRKAADVADTCTDAVFLHTMDIHYQTTNMATLNKAPNFYNA